MLNKNNNGIANMQMRQQRVKAQMGDDTAQAMAGNVKKRVSETGVENEEEKLNKIVRALLWVTVLVLPLFFLPNTPSVLELNKQALLVGLVGVAFLIWVGKMAVKSQIKFRANFIFIPIFIFLIVMALSTFFADYSYQSLWGFFGGEARSLVSLIFFVAFFILFVNVVKTKKDIVTTLVIALAGGFIVTVFGLLQLWGKYILPIEGTHTNFFNTIGSVHLFGVYVSVLFLLALNLFIYAKRVIFKVGLGILGMLFFVTLIIVGLKIVWIAVVLALALILGGIIISEGKEKGSSFNTVIPMVFIVLALLMIMIRQPLIKRPLPSEVLLGHKTSANIAWSAIKQDFLLGSGPTNYVNVYREFRPLGLGQFWATNFNSASSYLLTLATTVGALGVLSFLALIIMSGVYLFKGMLTNDDKTATLSVGIGSVWVLLSLLLMFYVTNITILFMWWLVLALLVTTLSFSSKTELREFSTGSDDDKPSLLFSFIFVLIIIGVVVALYLQGQRYVAAVHFNKALIADAKGEDVEKVAEGINKAILIDMDNDLYYRNRSLAYFAMANKRVAEKGAELTPDDAAYVSELIKFAIVDANKALSLDGGNLDNILSLMRIYESLLPTMEGAGEEALKYAREAVVLDPNNPAIYQRLANIFVTMADLETIKNQSKDKTELPEKAKEYLASARKALNEAIELKPDLLAARLALVGIFDREGNDDEAIATMLENVNIFQGNPNLAFQLGLLYLRNDKIDEAGGRFLQAVRIDSRYANARYFLGLIYDKKGERDLAIGEFEKVLELNPENELVEKILENLRADKDALEGLQQASEKVDTKEVEEEVTEEREASDSSQPTINPEIEEGQTIPENVVQELETDSSTTDDEKDNEDKDSEMSEDDSEKPKE